VIGEFVYCVVQARSKGSSISAGDIWFNKEKGKTMKEARLNKQTEQTAIWPAI
jgi:hypothetical protein